jgi:hypothetical protein
MSQGKLCIDDILRNFGEVLSVSTENREEIGILR